MIEVGAVAGVHAIEIAADWIGLGPLKMISNQLSKSAFLLGLPLFFYYLMLSYRDYEENAEYNTFFDDPKLWGRGALAATFIVKQILDPAGYGFFTIVG